MNKIILVFLTSCLPAYIIAQEMKPELQPPAYFSFLAVGEIPPIILEPGPTKDSVKIKPIDSNRVPPGVLFYKEDPIITKKNAAIARSLAETNDPTKENKEEKFKRLGLYFNCTTPWIKNEAGNNTLALLNGIQTKGGGAISYKPYLTAALPQSSRAALFVLSTPQGAKNWDNPRQLVIPVEYMLNPDYTRKDGAIILNTLNQALWYQISGKKGTLKPGGFVFIPTEGKGKIQQFKFQIMKNNKLLDIGNASFTPSSTGVTMFFTYWNPYVRKGEPNEKTSRCSFDLPPIAPPLPETSAAPAK